jgi:hypothetical protein
MHAVHAQFHPQHVRHVTRFDLVGFESCVVELEVGRNRIWHLQYFTHVILPEMTSVCGTGFFITKLFAPSKCDRDCAWHCTAKPGTWPLRAVLFSSSSGSSTAVPDLAAAARGSPAAHGSLGFYPAGAGGRLLRMAPQSSTMAVQWPTPPSG